MGKDSCEGLPDWLVGKARRKIARDWGASVTDSGLQREVFEQLMKDAGDPDEEVPKWLQDHTPLGIDRIIVPGNVFPIIEPKSVAPALSKLTDLIAGWHVGQRRAKGATSDENYKSYDDNKGGSRGGAGQGV